MNTATFSLALGYVSLSTDFSGHIVFPLGNKPKKKCKWLKKKVGCYRLSLEWFGVLVFVLGDKVISHPVRKGDLVCRRVK